MVLWLRVSDPEMPGKARLGFAGSSPEANFANKESFYYKSALTMEEYDISQVEVSFVYLRALGGE